METGRPPCILADTIGIKKIPGVQDFDPHVVFHLQKCLVAGDDTISPEGHGALDELVIIRVFFYQLYPYL
jgi:hypothetical protein